MRSINAVLSARSAPEALSWSRLSQAVRRGKRTTAAVSAALVTASLATGILFIAAPAAVADPAPIAERNANMVTADALPTVQQDGVVWAQAISGNTVYAGGSFANARPAGSASGSNNTPRANLLAYDITTGVLNTSFNPGTNQQVRAVVVSPDGTRLFIGGDFTTVGGVTHNRIAEFNATTGALMTSFVANLDGGVRSLYATNTTVYAGGVFANANQTARARVAAFDVNTGALLAWNPSADAVVTAITMTPDKSRIVLGGSFQNLGTTPTYGLGAVDPISGAPLSWAATAQIQDAGANAGITSLVADNNAVYGTGFVYGAGGNLEGAFSTDSAGNINWIEDCHGDTYGVYPGDGAVYTISHSHYCNNVGAFPQTSPWTFHHSLAWTTNATGTLLHDQTGGTYHDWFGSPSPTQYNWYPDFTTGTVTGQNQAAWSVAGNGTYLVEGGEFPTVNGAAQQGLVRFAIPSVSGHKQGAMVTGSKFVPSIVSLTPGTARIAFQANWDRDDEVLTYKVVRNSNTTAPVYTTTVTSQFWNRPNLGFTDTGLTAGVTYKYRLYVTDPDGNQVAGDTVSYTEPSVNPQSTYASDVLHDGATDYWRLGESSGTTAYDYASFNDLTLGSTVTHGATGAINGDADQADNFDGSSTGFGATNNAIPGPNTFTEELWFKTTSTSGGKLLGFGNANTGNSSSYDRHIYMDTSGHVYFGVYNGNVNTISTSNALNDGQYHYVVASLSSAGMSLYVDGKFVGNNSANSGQDYSGYWRVGGDNLGGWTNGSYFTGTIDDVAVYPTVLTAAQIRQHYVDSGRTFAGISAPADNYGKTIYNDSPNLYYRMDETSGTTATDLSGNGNDGTYNGGQTLGVASPVSGTTGTAVKFDGAAGTLASNIQVQAPSVYSEEIWFNTTTNQGGKLIGFGNTQTGNSSNYDRHIYMENSGQLTFGTYTGQLNTATTTNSYNDGKWHYMVATQAADGMKLYVDGVLAATNSQTQAQGYSGYWRIGGDSDWGGSSAYFNGTLDEAAVYPYELTQAQVTAHYQASPAATQPNQAPVASFTETSSNLMVNVDGTGSTDADGSIASYAWDFGDGATATTATASHTYAAAGNYTITLVVTDNQGATSTATQAVTVSAANVAPTAAFTATPTNLSVAFDGTGSHDPDGTIASYSWNFGDGSAAGTGSNPTHVYTAAGNYTVTLTVTDNGGATGTISSTVTVTAPPNVPPTAVISASTTNLTVNVDGTGSSDSDGTIASYAWNFGDGATATTATATHTYAAAGTYTVSLTVTDNGGATGTATYSAVVTAANVAPTASFTAATSNLTATFDGSGSKDSDGTIASYSWNFGDGSAAGTTVNPSHTYAAAGTYTVTLTVTDNGGLTGTASNPVTVSAANVAPTAAFTSTTANLTANFDGSGSSDSDGSIASYSWNFGDGSAAGTTVNPSHTYAAAGTYTVTLTVTDNGGLTGTASNPVTVSAANVAPTAAFTSTPTNLSVAFNGSGSKDSDGTIASYSWNFGDNSTAGTGVSPSHTYAAAGTYTVTLTVTDNGGLTGTASSPVTVTAAAGATPLATDSFTRTTTNGLGSADLGGAWTTTGTASLFAVNGGVAKLTMNKLGSGPSAFLNGVSAGDVNETVDVSLDSVPTGGGTYVALAARRIGTSDYRVKVRFQPSSTTIQLTKMISGTETVLSTATVAGYVYAAGDVVRIRLTAVGSSPTTLTGKLWKVGTTEPSTAQVTTTDTTAALQSPGGVGIWTYLASSAVTVPVTASFDNLAATTPGTAPANVAPSASFTSTTSNLTAIFDGSGSKDSDGSIASYSWNFGDNSTAGTGVNPSHTYAAAGTYTVTLTVTDNGGLTGTASNPVTVTAPVGAQPVATDTFGRTVTSGLGSADLGGAWTTTGTASLFAVNGGVAKLTMNKLGSGPSAFLNSVSTSNVTETVDVSLDSVPTGGGTYVALAARRIGTSDYRVKVRFQPSSTTIQLTKMISGTETVLSTATVAGYTYAAGDVVRIKLQLSGTGTTTLSGKLWKVGTTEPTAAQVSTTDTTAALQNPGGVGIWTYLASSAVTVPVTASFDNLAATNP